MPIKLKCFVGKHDWVYDSKNYLYECKRCGRLTSITPHRDKKKNNKKEKENGN